ncbi:RAD55 family ATPase [Halomicroarcula sp. GCM10025324]|uniref:RAD55 family ATPase n=1 Tax=Haloarcula TaxID=2237 RepID=UPI0023E83062|nr:ATPase domain-containing protein [Halomicroarcula sp. ZS-22-S1]
MSGVASRYETGIGPLDTGLGGGIPAGSIVALLAAPTSQSELLLSQFATDRPTLYLTARRSVSSVRKAFESTGAEASNRFVRAVDSDAPLVEIAGYVKRVAKPSVVVIDPMDAVETCDTKSLRRFLVWLQERLDATESIAVLHCLAGSSASEQRDVTTYMADLVFNLETSVDNQTVENRLSVPKFRGGPALPAPLNLELTERVAVDID